jgi:hypothetical protein
MLLLNPGLESLGFKFLKGLLALTKKNMYSLTQLLLYWRKENVRKSTDYFRRLFWLSII